MIFVGTGKQCKLLVDSGSRRCHQSMTPWKIVDMPLFAWYSCTLSTLEFHCEASLWHCWRVLVRIHLFEKSLAWSLSLCFVVVINSKGEKRKQVGFAVELRDFMRFGRLVCTSDKTRYGTDK